MPITQTGDAQGSINGMHELRWTIQCDKERSVTAMRVPAEIESFAYIMREADRLNYSSFGCYSNFELSRSKLFSTPRMSTLFAKQLTY